MPAPELSVVIACYRPLPALALQLEALARQTDAPALEVLLCANGPGDAAALAATVRQHRSALPGLRVVPAAEHPGAAYARNVGAAAARAEKLAFCDADDVVAPGWARAAADLLDRYPVVSGGSVTLDLAGWAALEVPGDVPASLRALQEHLARHQGHGEPAPAGRGSVAPVLMGGNFAVRAEVFRDLGGFDASFVRGSEDTELGYRIQQAAAGPAPLAGAALMESPELAILYRVRSGWRAEAKEGFRDAQSLAMLCARHDAWGQAVPYRTAPAVQVLRAAGSAARMALALPQRRRRAGRAQGGRPAEGTAPDWAGVLRRAAIGAGLFLGRARYGWARRVPPARVGLGLYPAP